MKPRKSYKARRKPLWKEVRRLEGMTNAELTVLLETLAKLVEATAKDAQDAARIIRDAIPNK